MKKETRLVSVSNHAMDQALDRCFPKRLDGVARPETERERMAFASLLRDVRLEVYEALAKCAEEEVKQPKNPVVDLGGDGYQAIAVLYAGATSPLRKDAYLIITEDTRNASEWIVRTVLDEETYQSRREKAKDIRAKRAEKYDTEASQIAERFMEAGEAQTVVLYKNGSYKTKMIPSDTVSEFIERLLEEGISSEDIRILREQKFQPKTVIEFLD